MHVVAGAHRLGAVRVVGRSHCSDCSGSLFEYPMPLRLILLAAIVALNGFFAAAEVALVSVRVSRLKELAEQGSASARVALDLLANPSRLLSTTQLGVTLASLGLGWAGEDTVYQILLSWLEP